MCDGVNLLISVYGKEIFQFAFGCNATTQTVNLTSKGMQFAKHPHYRPISSEK